MSAAEDWTNFDLDGDPILVVGRRPAPKALEGFVIELQQDTFDAMRDIARTTTGLLVGRVPLEWHPNASAEQGEEYLVIDVADLPSTPVSQSMPASTSPGQSDSRLTEASALLRIVLAPGALDNLDPSDTSDAGFRFYAVVWEAGDKGGPVAFVSEYDPTMILRKANKYFRYDGTLRLADPPDFALNDRAQLIITTEKIAILKAAVFDRLFSDIRTLLNDVPGYVRALDNAFAKLPFSSESQKALELMCSTRPTFARRLQNLGSYPGAGNVTPALLRIALKDHGAEPADFIRKGVVEIAEASVAGLLDVLEGRWYEADFSDEPRRAATWSRRPAGRPNSPDTAVPRA